MPLDLASLLYIDFEARSELDIRKVGAHVYATHPSTEPLCAAWCVGDGPMQLWKMGEPVPPQWQELAYTMTWVAHNKDTERLILYHKFGITVPDWIDTATLASQAGLPRASDEVCQALGLPPTGDTSAMLQLARPRKASQDNQDRFWTPETRPDLFTKLYAYCQDDTESARRILKALPPWHWLVSNKERILELLTDKMNSRGLVVDLDGVFAAKAEVRLHTERLKTEFQTVMPGVNPKSATKRAEALGMYSTDKEAVRDELRRLKRDPNHDNWSRVKALEIIKTLNTAATGKLDAFQQRTSSDGKLHGAMVYCGAGRTWRWSSMGVQLHNLLRGLGSGSVDWPAIDTSENATDLAFGALHNDIFSELYDNPTRAVAAMMKGFLVGPFLMGDYSQIEPRVGAMLSRQTSLLEAFRNRKDPYISLASEIYSVPPDRVNTDQRFMGKQGVLGCGYGLGPDGFIGMLKTIYGIDVSEEEAKRIVFTYRRMNPDIVAFWYNLEYLVKQGVLEQWQSFHTSPNCPGIGVRMYKSWLVIRLPSGRCLWYFQPELVVGDRGLELHYWGRNPKYGGRWMRVKTYGGKLTENITQAVARDIMAEAMLRLEAHGYEVLMTVHDEIVCNACPGGDPAKDVLPIAKFEEVMLQPPAWMREIPLAVDVQLTERYQK